MDNEEKNQALLQKAIHLKEQSEELRKA